MRIIYSDDLKKAYQSVASYLEKKRKKKKQNRKDA